MVIYEYSKKQLIIPDGIQDYSLEELEQAYQSGYTNGLDDGYADGYADGLDDCVSGECDTCYTEGFEDGVASGVTYQKSLLSSTAITSNGNYISENGFSGVTVNVPQTGETINNQVKSSNLTVNGTYIATYDSGYTGLERVDITVAVPQTGHTDQEMADAYESGITYQKSLMEFTAFTENGRFSSENGWYQAIVDVHPEVNLQDKSVSYSSNGSYTVKATKIYDGLGTVTVNVDVPSSGYTQEDLDDAYQSGVTDGINEQKAKLTGETFNQNGTYTLADGWSAVTINVSGYTQEDLDAAFASGWTAGYESGYTDGLAAKYISVVSSVNFDLSGATEEVVIGSNTEWVVSTSDSWIAITPTSGFGNGTIEVTVESGSTSREGSIVITSADGQITKTIVIRQRNNEYLNQYLTFEIISGGTINWKHTSNTDSKTIQYSINGGAWTNLVSSVNGDTVSVNDGDIVRFRGDNYTYGISLVKYHTFEGTTAIFNAYGNIMSLVDSENFSTITTLPNDYMFACLFINTGIINANNLVLPATTLTPYCYYHMFRGCSSLTTAPELPATTLVPYCYENMFGNCHSLLTAPELPATTLATNCYGNMFNRCYSLTQAPVLPATTLASVCYMYMFAYCSGLTQASELPATILTNSCYNGMFSGCTSLTTAPTLPATTLVNNCYKNMFTACESLNYIKCLATDISATECTYEWVNGTASSGTFIKNSNSNWERGDSGIPVGWTIQDAS